MHGTEKGKQLAWIVRFAWIMCLALAWIMCLALKRGKQITWITWIMCLALKSGEQIAWIMCLAL
jgi:hypothetical protein